MMLVMLVKIMLMVVVLVILMLPIVLMICLSGDLGGGVVLGGHDDDVGNAVGDYVGDDADDGVGGDIDDLCGVAVLMSVAMMTLIIVAEDLGDDHVGGHVGDNDSGDNADVRVMTCVAMMMFGKKMLTIVLAVSL